MAIRTVIETGAGTIGRFLPIIVPEKNTDFTSQHAALISDGIGAVTDAINGQLSFGTGAGSTRGGNFNSQWIAQIFTTANVEVEIPHGLGRKPVDVWFGIPSKACRFYTAMRRSWTLNTIWIACDTDAVEVPLLIF